MPCFKCMSHALKPRNILSFFESNPRMQVDTTSETQAVERIAHNPNFAFISLYTLLSLLSYYETCIGQYWNMYIYTQSLLRRWSDRPRSYSFNKMPPVTRHLALQTNMRRTFLHLLSPNYLACSSRSECKMVWVKDFKPLLSNSSPVAFHGRHELAEVSGKHGFQVLPRRSMLATTSFWNNATVIEPIRHFVSKFLGCWNA